MKVNVTFCGITSVAQNAEMLKMELRGKQGFALQISGL